MIKYKELTVERNVFSKTALCSIRVIHSTSETHQIILGRGLASRNQGRGMETNARLEETLGAFPGKFYEETAIMPCHTIRYSKYRKFNTIFCGS